MDFNDFLKFKSHEILIKFLARGHGFFKSCFFRYIGHDDEEDTMDSSNSSTVQPTSNLIAPDSLKRHHNNANTTSTTTSVRFSLDSEPRTSENHDSNQENTAIGKPRLPKQAWVFGQSISQEVEET